MNSPNIGAVIGTYGAVPYIHLSLESRKRHYASVPLLVSDDCSPSARRLEALCQRYGTDFISNTKHMPDHYGDLSVFVNGLRWAKEKNIDLLMKFSRRFIPLFDWSKDLERFYEYSEAATYSNYCSAYGFGFRTECLALHVPTWYSLGLVDEMEQKLSSLDGGLFMEGYMHQLAQRAMFNTSQKATEWFTQNPVPPERLGYYPLHFMGTSRIQPKVHVLWHDYTHPMQYLSKCQEWGIFDYTPTDFYLVNR
jgi:hypothetical protein